MTRRRRRGRRGQAIVEAALVVPMLVVITLGCTDMAQAYRFATDVAGASRAGMRVGIMSDATDIGDAIRAEPNSVVSNTVASWGNDGYQQADDGCTTTSTPCGDPGGCSATSAFWTSPPAGQPDPIACFAVRSCVLNSSQQCTTFGAWGSRPDPSKNCGLDVVVAYRFVPVTPAVARFTPGGTYFLSAATEGLALYTCS